MDQRSIFAATATRLMGENDDLAIVLADISVDLFADAARRHPERTINVGIREQLQVGVAGGLGLAGFRPIVHTYAPFLVERAYEQVKLDLDHQGVGAILVSVGASYDSSQLGRTHFSPGDVALFDTLGEWTVEVPGHPDEVVDALQEAAFGRGRVYIRLEHRSNTQPHRNLEIVQDGSQATIFAVGPVLDRVVEAAAGLDLKVVYIRTPRPLDAARVSELAATQDVFVVEPYLRGTSSRVFADALGATPRRFRFAGVGPVDLHRYGTPEDHDRLHGLDIEGLRAFLTSAAVPPPL